MLKEIIEKKQKIQRLKQDCFNARKALIVKSDKETHEVTGCIKLMFSIECGLQDACRVGVQPEHTYRFVGPRIRYCIDFNANRPLERKCNTKSCPMYDKYQEYIKACEALQAAKSK